MRNCSFFKRFASMALSVILLCSLCGCGVISSNNTSATDATLSTVRVPDTSPFFNPDSLIPSTSHSQIDDIVSDSGQMTVHFIDVGQGDSSFIELPNGEKMLIDAGGSYDKNPVVPYLKAQGITNIDYVVATHPHADHINYLADVINVFDVETFYTPNVVSTTKTFERMLSALENHNVPVEIVSANDVLLDEGGLLIEVLGPTEDSYDDYNGYSVIIKIEYQDVGMLFMGDAEVENEEAIVGDINVDVIKIGHHGSDTSSSQNFVNRTSPMYGIISAERGNSYGHPHSSVVERWTSVGTQLYQTMDCGTIIAVTDGNTINISGVPMDGDNGASAPQFTSPSNDSEGADESTYFWVLNTKSMKIHYSTCEYAEKISDKNRAESTDSLAELFAQGYSSCGACKPKE